MKYKLLYLIISSFFIALSIFSLLVWGLKPSIDFVGGTLWEIRFDEHGVAAHELASSLKSQGVDVYSIYPSGDRQFLIRFRALSDEEKNKIKENLSKKFGRIEELRFDTVGPTLGKELLTKTVIAIILASSLILLYVAWRFKDKMYGVCAILAMFHDSIILIGSFSLLGHFYNVEVDTLFVTAVLTILSFSVHDTIVVYDRIRESVRQNPKLDFEWLVDKALTETIVRSLNNSLTIIFMLTALVVLGGVTIKWFAMALLVGTISGTYSSAFVASPLLVVWRRIRHK